MVVGASSIELWQIEMLAKTAFMRTTLTARFTHFSPQELIILFNLSIRGRHWEAFGLVLKSGTHRYLKESQLVKPSIPRTLEISSISLGEVFHP